MKITSIPLEVLIALSLISNLLALHMPVRRSKDMDVSYLFLRIIRVNTVGVLLAGGLYIACLAQHTSHGWLLLTTQILTIFHTILVAMFLIVRRAVTSILDNIERHMING